MNIRMLIALLTVSQLLFPKHAKAQEFTGYVVDSVENFPLSYVNIGVVGKNIGTVSDVNGNFKITLDPIYDSDTIRFSMVGYGTKAYLISNFRKLKLAQQSKIYLSPQPMVLREVVILSKNSLRQAVGTKPKSKLVNAGFINNKLGHEIGSLFRNNNGELLIDSVRLNIVKCNYENVYLRLNVYEVLNDKMENILKKPIYITLTRQQALSNPVINLAEFGITVDHNFLISVELIKDLGEKGLYFYANINDEANPGMYRLTSQGPWTFMKHKSKPVGISIMAYVH